MKESKQKPSMRRHVLAIKMTQEEKHELSEFAKKNSVNLSAFVRKVVFEKLRES